MDLITAINARITAAGGTLYYVGGFVRDHLLGRQTKDIDLLVTGLDWDALQLALKPLGATDPIGRSFAILKLRDGEHELDIALPRRERSTGEGHRDFRVDYGPDIPLAEDLGRRDFTVNAMAMAVGSERIIDPFNGQRDLARRLLRQVFPQSIPEDYLRALRAMQFSARLDFKLEARTLKSITEHKRLIHTLSAERVQGELFKLLTAPHVRKGFAYMLKSGLLQELLPELVALDDERYNHIHHKYNSYQHTLRSLELYNLSVPHPDPGLCLAILLHDLGKAVIAEPDEQGVYHHFRHEHESTRLAALILSRLRFGNDISEQALRLIKNHMLMQWELVNIRRTLGKLGEPGLRQLWTLIYFDRATTRHPFTRKEWAELQAKLDRVLAEQSALIVKDLALNGNDLLELGYSGPQIGAAQRYLLDHVTEHPHLNTADKLIELLKDL